MGGWVHDPVSEQNRVAVPGSFRGKPPAWVNTVDAVANVIEEHEGQGGWGGYKGG